MPAEVLMPALSPTMTEGKLARWLINEGQAVKSGAVLAEIETDKATMEVEAIDDGILHKIFVNAGTEGVAVNTPIAVILREGESAEAIKAPAAAVQSVVQSIASPAPSVAVAAPSAAPVAAQVLVAGQNRPASSPLARRIAAEKGISLSAVQGTGPGGRIIKADVEGYKAAAVAAPVISAPKVASQQVAAAATDDSTLIPLDGMRKTVAKRLTEAKQTVPHFYLSRDIRLDALLSFREQINKAAPEGGYKISVNDFVIKALAQGLRAVPDANVTWADTAIRKHHTVDVGVAVAVEGGLFTPVIRNADQKTLSVISNEMKDLAARARSKKLKPEEYAGGSASISNLGMFGVKAFDAIINPPQSLILAVGAGEKRAIVDAGNNIIAAEVMTVTMSIDHRALDGALGAKLLGEIKRLIENPLGLLV